jgi:hypothetical protein
MHDSAFPKVAPSYTGGRKTQRALVREVDRSNHKGIHEVTPRKHGRISRFVYLLPLVVDEIGVYPHGRLPERTSATTFFENSG